MKLAVWICVVLLLVLHQDYWQWDNATLDFGFLPRTITYHAGLSVIAAVLWWATTYACWPADLAESEDSTEEVSS
jgi:hypothetical protein